MALFQAGRVADALRALAPDMTVEVVAFSTDGDRWTGPLAELGGKGAFTRRLDQAQLAGDCDICVHCLKDIPGDVPLPAGLEITAFTAREDPRDAVVSRHLVGLDQLPAGAVIGTSAVRRGAQLAKNWPALQATPLRGNADTRLAKLDAGDLDAVIVAAAGLQRIGAADRITETLPVERMLPAIGAGVIAITTRIGDQPAAGLVQQLDDPVTRRAATAERVMLGHLGGHCQSPIAGHATPGPDGHLHLVAAVYSLDASVCLEAARSGDDPEELGAAVAAELLSLGARDLIDTSRV
jgi:hydroxymethylbilane synthase